MEHVSSDALEWEPAPAEHFTGRAWFGPLASPLVPGALDALGVFFEPAARTDWHRHPEGQVLYVVAGTGLVQTEEGETVTIRAGDVVTSPPGEVHWHGATAGSFLFHLSLTTGGGTDWVGGPVTDQEFRRRD